MPAHLTKCLIIVGLSIGSNVSAWSVDGKEEYLANCTGCHGADGKGSPSKTSKPPDLTTIAKRNRGVFSHEDVYEMIDGRKSSRAHRLTDMPIWGCRHRPPPAKWEKTPKPDDYERLLDLPCPPEEDIRGRIQAIVDFLSSIQAK